MNKYLTKNYFKIYTFDLFVIVSIVLSVILLTILLFNKTDLDLLLIILLLPFICISLIYLIYQPFTFKLKLEQYLLDLKQNTFTKNTQDLGGFKIVFISDLHFHELLPQKYVDKWITEINKIKPDLLLIGGDFVVDRLTDFALLNNLAKLGNYPKLAVLGNHDYDLLGKDFAYQRTTERNLKYADSVQEKVESCGIQVLRNENYYIENLDLNVFGSDCVWAKMHDLSKLKPAERNIILAHNPLIFPDLNKPNINLVLTGHNHGGGQMKINRTIAGHRVFGRLPLPPFKFMRTGFGEFVEGLYTNKYGIKMYISRGLGVTGIRVRINCRPEITLIKVTA